VDDETLFVRRRGGATEDAAGLLVRLLYVLEPPGRPERLRHRRQVTPGVPNR
jgi:hypothetical protein